jgi:hypothetical protein
MTKARALKEAQQRWGKRAIIRFSPKALLASEKIPLRERRKAIKAELETLPRIPETQPRRSALLREERDLIGQVLGDRCNVGQEMDILAAFHVMGAGDTWEQAFAQADERYPRPTRAAQGQGS